MIVSSPAEHSTAVVARYLDRLVAHDWAGASACLADGIVRVGPFGDTYEGREPYVAFLSELMPTLSGYAMRIDRILAAAPDAGGAAATVIAELTETVEMDGAPVATPEVLVFDLDADGRIAHIAIYIQHGGRAG